MSTDGASRRVLLGHGALVVVQVCFGLFPLFGRWAFVSPGGFAPLAVATWRILFGGLALGALALLVHGRAAIPRRRDLGLFALCSLLGVVLNQVLFLEGLERSTATNAGLVMCLIPVFTFAIAALVGQERFHWMRGAGLAVALFGASMLFWAQDADFRRAYGFGNLLMALNCLSYSVYLVISKPLARDYPPLAVIAWVYLLAIPVVPFLSHGEVLVPDSATPRAWASLAYILLVPTTTAYVLNVFALARLRASTTAVYVYVQPLIAASAGHVFLDEELTRGLAVAGVCIFVGIWLVARRPPTQTVPPTSAENPEAPHRGAARRP